MDVVLNFFYAAGGAVEGWTLGKLNLVSRLVFFRITSIPGIIFTFFFCRKHRVRSAGNDFLDLRLRMPRSLRNEYAWERGGSVL